MPERRAVQVLMRCLEKIGQSVLDAMAGLGAVMLLFFQTLEQMQKK